MSSAAAEVFIAHGARAYNPFTLLFAIKTTLLFPTIPKKNHSPRASTDFMSSVARLEFDFHSAKAERAYRAFRRREKSRRGLGAAISATPSPLQDVFGRSFRRPASDNPGMPSAVHRDSSAQ